MMKIIDLLNKIANGEEAPKKIKYDDNIYAVNKIVLEKGKIDIDYYCNDNCEMLFADVIPIHRCLNEEVEILEEEKKIPEKLNLDKDELLKKVIITAQDYVIEGKINEIIDYLKSKGE